MQFVCDVCQKTVPANPDLMLTTSVDVSFGEEGEGEEWKQAPADLSRDQIKQAVAHDRLLSLFASGAICACFECQENMGLKI